MYQVVRLPIWLVNYIWSPLEMLVLVSHRMVHPTICVVRLILPLWHVLVPSSLHLRVVLVMMHQYEFFLIHNLYYYIL